MDEVDVVYCIKHENIVKGVVLECVEGPKPSKCGLKTKQIPCANGTMETQY